MKMIKLITLMLLSTLFASQVSAFKNEDLEKLKLGNQYGESSSLGILIDCEKCDLTGAQLSVANLSKANLRDANLSGANLNETDLTGADLGDANLQGVNLVLANLAGANLSGADLSGGDLSVANLEGVDLKDVKLDGAILCHTTMPAGKENNLGCKKKQPRPLLVDILKGTADPFPSLLH